MYLSWLSWSHQFFAGRPIARVVALFTALNLLTVLLFTLLVPARPFAVFTELPLQNPTQTAWRVGAAILVYLVVLWAIRPNQRKPWEFVLLLGIAGWVVGLLTQFYLPFLALGLIPVVARYWLPLWAVGIVVAALVGLSIWWGIREPMQISFEVLINQGPRGATTWSAVPSTEPPNLTISFFVFIAFIFAGYSLLTLEMLVRETKARSELETTRRELEETSREAGVLQERQRLAREIHDTLSQNFASIVLQLEAAEAASSPKHITQARQSAREGLSDARRMVWALRPELLENAPLTEALKQYTQRWQQENQVLVKLTCTEEIPSLHPQLEVSVLRIIQEALTNVRKHAQASRVNITLSYLGDLILLDVQDNGIGLPAERKLGSFGLQSILERVEALGGTFNLESEHSQGTTLAISLPVPFADTL
jgi:signal transduction histidine kinase